MCGHEIMVPCHQEAAFLDNPNRCTERCHRIMEGCGHVCERKCGGCLDRTLKKNPDFVLSDSNAHLIEHGRCQSLCGKKLLCGHECREKCHPGEIAELDYPLSIPPVDRQDCGPCKEKCSVVCEHRRRGCDKTCSEPCVSCAEPCSWECEHEGECDLPCGAPCNRLPCDQRCNKILACGCRCPSLCGEECPSPEFCLVHAGPRVKNMVSRPSNVDSFVYRVMPSRMWT